VRYAAEFQQQISDLFVVGCVNDRDVRLPLSADDEYAFTDLFTYLILGILSGLDLLPERFMHADSELPDMHDLKIESLCYQIER
jgi:hypothetical protein